MTDANQRDSENLNTDLPADPSHTGPSWSARVARGVGRASRHVRDGGAFVASPAVAAARATWKVAGRLRRVRSPDTRSVRMRRSATTALEQLRELMASSTAADDDDLLGNPRFWQLVRQLHGLRALAKVMEQATWNGPGDETSTDGPARGTDK